MALCGIISVRAVSGAFLHLLHAPAWPLLCIRLAGIDGLMCVGVCTRSHVSPHVRPGCVLRLPGPPCCSYGTCAAASCWRSLPATGEPCTKKGAMARFKPQSRLHAWLWLWRACEFLLRRLYLDSRQAGLCGGGVLPSFTSSSVQLKHVAVLGVLTVTRLVGRVRVLDYSWYE